MVVHLLAVVLSALVFLSQHPCPSQAIILCDGDCMDNTELEICRPYNDSRTPLYVMAFFPCNTNTFRARGFTVAAQMAVRAVQRDTTLLPDYSLRLSFDNTQCDRLSATRAFIGQLPERRHMIIGPGCSSGAVTVAEISPFYNLTQISYTATSISLSDTRRFPNFFRTISSDNASIDTITAVVREYGWQQVAIVTELSELYSNLTTELSSALVADGVKIITNGLAFTGGENDPSLIVQHLNTSGARVVILNVFEASAREIFCLAYQRGMVYPRYLFISYYQYSEFWWTDPIRNTSNYPMPQCSVLDLTRAIFRSLAVDYFPMPTADEEVNVPTDVGYDSPAQFWDEFQGNLSSLNYTRSEALRQSRFVYDAVWAAAYALHNTSELLGRGAVRNTSLTLDDFNDSQFRNEINQIILKSTRNLKFRGVSGKVKLNKFGDREPTRQIFQYIDETVVNPEDPMVETLSPFARVDEVTGKLIYEEGSSEATVFPEGVPEVVEEVFVHPALFGFYTILAALGIIFAIVCLVFNLVFKEKKLVKLSSPYLNTLIILGAILLYIDVILFGIDKNVAPENIVDINCQATIWLAAIGFSLLFGTMLAKTWRVYYIFRSVKLKKKPLKDWILFIVVAIIVAVDIVFLIIVSVDVWRLRLNPQLVFRQGGAVPQVVGVCSSEASTFWLPILLAYKCLYLIVGLWLATTTYRVKIKELRDSKLIVACVIGITVVSLVLTLITFLLPTLPNATYGVIGSFIWVLLTAVLFLLFVTRMIELYRDSSGEVDITGRSSEGKSAVLSNLSTQDDVKKIAELRSTIKSLQMQIEEAKQRRAGKAGDSNGVGAVTSDSDLEHELNASAAGSVAHLLSPDHDGGDDEETGASRNGVSVELSFELRQNGEDTDKKDIDTSNL